MLDCVKPSASVATVIQPDCPIATPFGVQYVGGDCKLVGLTLVAGTAHDIDGKSLDQSKHCGVDLEWHLFERVNALGVFPIGVPERLGDGCLRLGPPVPDKFCA